MATSFFVSSNETVVLTSWSDSSKCTKANFNASTCNFDLNRGGAIIPDVYTAGNTLSVSDGEW